ncbi:MAG TPA: FimV/HubP family polar landmark protein, partial [Nitrospiraceae bacterium]|nr:FimV/HubP family polar landmark protein [Nitrospiraceae bacterium]
MVAKSVKRTLSLSLLLPSVSLALGLGDIRLLSSLNAPLDAEIELIGATPDELASLKAAIASRDTFARYGLEAPAYLNTVTLTPAKSSDGRDVIKLRSTETITEPFVTMLVQVEFSRGKLVREYTMLLDPPVFTPGSEQVASAPIAAPATAVDSRAGEIARAPVEPEPAPPPPAETVAQEQPLTPEADPGLPPPEPEQPLSGSADVPSLTPLIDSSTHQVRKGETLSGLADRFSTPTDINRWMVSTYQGNPGAFDGSMNVLRAGAVLRLPDQSTVTSIAPDEATAEVRRQYASYRSSAGSSLSGPAEPDRGQLRLVAAPATPGSGPGGASSGDIERLRNRVVELESDLQESRRLLKLKNDELARMQQRLS